jgi:acetolactate synthase small subunit
MYSQYRVAAPSLNAGVAPAANAATLHTVCFLVEAVAECGVMPRVLEQFAKRNLLPHRIAADVAPEIGVLEINLQMPGLTLEEGEQIARGLRAIIGVTIVLTSTKERR